MKVISILIFISPVALIYIAIVAGGILARGRRNAHAYYQPWQQAMLRDLDSTLAKMDNAQLLNSYYAFTFAIKEGMAEDADPFICERIKEYIEKKGLTSLI